MVFLHKRRSGKPRGIVFQFLWAAGRDGIYFDDFVIEINRLKPRVKVFNRKLVGWFVFNSSKQGTGIAVDSVDAELVGSGGLWI